MIEALICIIGVVLLLVKWFKENTVTIHEPLEKAYDPETTRRMELFREIKEND